MSERGAAGRAWTRFRTMSAVQQLTLLGSAGLLGGVYVGTVVGSVCLARQRRWLALGLPVLVAGYFVALSSGPQANSRFRVPMLPLLAIVAAAGIDRGTAVASSDRERRGT